MKKFKKEIKIFAGKIANEAKETQEAASLVKKHLSGTPLTEEEEKILRQQFYDILKMTGIGVPFFIIPGASVILTVIVVYFKKKNINILPSSFDDKDKDPE